MADNNFEGWIFKIFTRIKTAERGIRKLYEIAFVVFDARNYSEDLNRLNNILKIFHEIHMSHRV